jgi:hypothetical protein
MTALRRSLLTGVCMHPPGRPGLAPVFVPMFTTPRVDRAFVPGPARPGADQVSARNDDRVGRTPLARLFDTDQASLLTEVVLKCVAWRDTINATTVSQQPDPESLQVDAATYRALDEFRQVVSHVAARGEHVDIDSVALLAIRRGLDALLSELVGAKGTDLVLRTLERLAAEHPDLVYRFVVERMREGDLDYQAFVEEWRRLTGGPPEA